MRWHVRCVRRLDVCVCFVLRVLQGPHAVNQPPSETPTWTPWVPSAWWQQYLLTWVPIGFANPTRAPINLQKHDVHEHHPSCTRQRTQSSASKQKPWGIVGVQIVCVLRCAPGGPSSSKCSCPHPTCSQKMGAPVRICSATTPTTFQG